MRRYWVRLTLAGFAVYTVIAVLLVFSTAAYASGAHETIAWMPYVANRFLEEWTCALFVPVLFWLVDRYPVSRRTWARNTPVLALGAVLSVVIKYVIMEPLFRLWTGRPTESLPLVLIDNGVAVLFDFAAIMGVAHAIRYYRQAQERERVAAELATQLVQSRLDALRAQVHPHFLFNTLNAAATLVHEDADAADRMLTRLAELLRISLERTSREISLEDELQLAQRYLSIMESRFSDRLTVECSADDDARRAAVPTFLLQPLLENALEHGIARRPGPGRLTIAAHRTNGRVVIAVRDDGPGMTGTADAGIGLSNTRARLDQLYGQEHSFALEAAPDGGTQAVISIPFRECAVS